MKNSGEEKIKIDFLGEEREYSTQYRHYKEWQIKILANSETDAIEKVNKWIENIEFITEEIDHRDNLGHFICRRIK